MRAYSMDLRERVLLDSDAGMKAADVAAKYRVSGARRPDRPSVRWSSVDGGGGAATPRTCTIRETL